METMNIMDLITPFDLKLLDKNIIKQIYSINTDFLCIGPGFSCGGHYPANRPDVLIYVGKIIKQMIRTVKKKNLK